MRDERSFLEDMLGSARAAISYVSGKTFEQFLAEPSLQDAVYWRFAIIGEAAKKLSPETRARLPDLPFGKISAMRDRLSHVYWRIDDRIVWTTATRDLPVLIDVLIQFLQTENPVTSSEADADLTGLKGKFIVLDGTEGCGKSTQAKMLGEALEKSGLQVLAVRDPGSTRIGEQIRGVLLDPRHTEMSMRAEMLLYMAARAQMMAELIQPALDAGKVVICDRFVSSTLAYQLGGDGLTADEIRAVANIAINGRWPDLTLLLDMPPDKSLARVRREKDRIEQRPMEYHEQVRRNYLAQAEAGPAHYRLIPADRDREQVHADVMTAVRSVIPVR